VAITRNMIFADFDEYDGNNDTWRRIPLDTSGPWSKYGHSVVMTRGGDLRFWGGRTCDYAAVTNCSAQEVNPNARLTLWTYQQSWTPASSSMRDGRGNHTATVLPGTTGYILVAGGTNGPSVLRSAELYDPALRTFTPTGDLNLARDLHTASLLPNGKVLIAGGYAADSVSTGPTTSAEIYYPREGVWRLTGSMTGARDSHSAITLPDGNILVFGGYNGGGYLETAEIYYSTVGVWRSIPAPTAAGTADFVTIPAGCNGEAPKRTKHTASLLRTGEIIFVGGINEAGVLSSTLLLNLFNPSRTKGWYCGQRLGLNGAGAGTVRYVHSHSALALPSGDILVSFGNDGQGHAETPPLALVYNPYDFPANGGWTNAVGINQTGVTFNHASVVLPGGTPVIVGGARGMGQPQRGTMLFDRLLSTYTVIGNMTRPRAYHTVTLTLGQELVAIGGYSNGIFTNDAEYYPVTISAPPDANMAGGPPSVRVSSITSVDTNGAIYTPGST
jgi:hypothetical protein